MKRIDELFGQAYHLYIVEENPRAAITLCRRIVKVDPNHHMARMLLANLLDDHGNKAEVKESRKHYVQALRRSSAFEDAWTAWREEDPIYNLAIWEQRHGKRDVAKILFCIDEIIKTTIKQARKTKRIERS